MDDMPNQIATDGQLANCALQLSAPRYVGSRPYPAPLIYASEWVLVPQVQAIPESNDSFDSQVPSAWQALDAQTGLPILVSVSDVVGVIAYASDPGDSSIMIDLTVA